MTRKNTPPSPNISIQVGTSTNSAVFGQSNGPIYIGPSGSPRAPAASPFPDPAAHVPAAPPPAFAPSPPPTSQRSSDPQALCQISWLHLTDLHVGQADKEHAWPTMRERFFDDLAQLHDASGPWDLVLFTGDLTQRGSPEEFARLDRTLDKLWDRFARLGSSPALLAVPGNHDLVRPARSTAALATLGQWHDDPAVRSDFWERPSRAARKLVNKAFEPYARWWQSRRPAAPPVREGLLPGDFAATVESGGLRLGVVGLNSTFLQLAGGDFEGKLDLDAHQLHALKTPGDDDAVDWLRSHHLNMLLTHHPMSWLHPAALVRAREHLCPAGRFALHLHGHMHEPDLLSQRRLGAATQRFFQGASLFGKEEWGDAGKGQSRLHGYAAARLTADLAHLRGEVRVWPRLLLRKPGGHSSIEPDRLHYDLDAANSLVEPLALRSPDPSPAPSPARPPQAASIAPAPAAAPPLAPDSAPSAHAASARAAGPALVYVSFADADAPFVAELEKHLAPHVRNGTLTLWHRGKLRPGEVTEPTIARELAAARVIVLLLSADHAAAMPAEVKTAVARHAAGAALVPVRVRAAEQDPSLAPFQSLPREGPPLKARRGRDSAWTEIVRGIVEVLPRAQPA